MKSGVMVGILIVIAIILFLIFGVGRIPEKACNKESLKYFNENKDACAGKINYICLGGDCKNKVSCCSGDIIGKFEFKGKVLGKWNSLESVDVCNESFGLELKECISRKCIVVDLLRKEFYNASVVGEFDELCNYYEEMPENKALYCKLDLNSEEEFGNCLEEYYLGNNSGCDEIVNDLIEEGICQIIGR